MTPHTIKVTIDLDRLPAPLGHTGRAAVFAAFQQAAQDLLDSDVLDDSGETEPSTTHRDAFLMDLGERARNCIEKISGQKLKLYAKGIRELGTFVLEFAKVQSQCLTTAQRILLLTDLIKQTTDARSLRELTLLRNDIETGEKSWDDVALVVLGCAADETLSFPLVENVADQAHKVANQAIEQLRQLERRVTRVELGQSVLAITLQDLEDDVLGGAQ